MGTLILCLNISLWLITLVIYLKKRKFYDSGAFIISSFLLYSIASLLLYLDKSVRGSIYTSKEITLLPLVYLFLMILLTTWPVLKYNQKKINSISSVGTFTIDWVSYIFIASVLIQIPEIIIHTKSGITQIMATSAGGLDIYNEIMDNSKTISKGITSIPTIFINLFSEIAILIGFYNIAKKRKKKLTIFIFIALFILPFYHISRAQRGPAVSILLTIFASYFLFNTFYSEKFKKNALIFTTCIIAILTIPFIALTSSRFDRGNSTAVSSVVSYIGQENLNFDIYAFDNNGLRHGDRVIPLFKQMAGCENVPENFWERRLKYPFLKINDEVFIGYVGDFLLDFGPLISTIIFIIFTTYFLKKSKPKNGIATLRNYLVLQFLIVLSIQGGMKLFPFADKAGLKIIAFILTYIFIGIESYLITMQNKKELI